MAAGGSQLLSHTVLLRTDGTAVACGYNEFGQCEVLSPDAGQTYVAQSCPTIILQASFDGDSIRCVTLGGVERFSIGAVPATRLTDIYDQLRADQRVGGPLSAPVRVDAVLPGGRSLSGASPEETVASAFGLADGAAA